MESRPARRSLSAPPAILRRASSSDGSTIAGAGDLAWSRDRAFMGEVERARADEPHVLGFFWGATGGAFSRTLVYWLVYDERGEIARPPDARSAAWKERAARTIPFFANAKGCRGEKEVRRLDGHFHVLVLWC